MQHQLKIILSDIQSSKNSHEQIGKALDIIRNLEYFKKLQDQFGAQYLLMCLPLISVLVLRKTQTLIDKNDHYVFMEGSLKAESLTSPSKRQVAVGTFIDLKQDHFQSFVADDDCYFIRIKKGIQTQNNYKKLSDKQRQSCKLLRENQKLLMQQQDSHKYQYFMKLPFLRCLGRFDFVDLVVKSTLKEYSQSYVTHLSGKTVTKIGCIISGKIKLTYSMDQTQERRPGDRDMQWNLSEADWIGLQQHLQDELMKSSGQVDSVSAIVAWIPVGIFNSKFNIRTNYQAINKLMNLTKTKREMFQKSYNCLKKTYELSKDSNRPTNQIKNQLEQKISGLQSIAKKRRSFHRAKFARELDIPSNIIHKVPNFQQTLPDHSLPKLRQKVMLFPEEYAATLVCPSLRKELARLEDNKNRNRPSLEASTRTVEYSPSKLYNTLYKKIAYQFQTVEPHSCSKQKTHKKTLHYNLSIYNNFRVNKYLRPRDQSPSARNNSLTLLPNLNETN